MENKKLQDLLDVIYAKRKHLMDEDYPKKRKERLAMEKILAEKDRSDARLGLKRMRGGSNGQPLSKRKRGAKR